MRKLLLHACCAPCSSGVVPQLLDYDVTLLFYNPNIDTLEEYNLRLDTLKDFVEKFNKEFNTNIKYIAIPYNHQEFISNVIGKENEPEGGNRCISCIDLRLDYSGKYAKENGFDLFCSTLSVSPHKNHNIINSLGEEIAKKYQIEYLPNNFKKNNGFLNSINNSKKYNLYRQTYCGCEFAKNSVK